MRTFKDYVTNCYVFIREETMSRRKLLGLGALGTAFGSTLGMKLGDMVDKDFQAQKAQLDAQKAQLDAQKAQLDAQKIQQATKSPDEELPLLPLVKPDDEEDTSPVPDSKPFVEESTLNLIKLLEGFRSRAYDDGFGNITIGYGSTEYDIPGLKIGDIITQKEAHEKLWEGLGNKYGEFIDTKVKVPLNQNQFDALVSWVYNIGVEQAATSTLIRRLNAGQYQKAADEFLRWNKLKGKIISGLTKRRKVERKLFLSSV